MHAVQSFVQSCARILSHLILSSCETNSSILVLHVYSHACSAGRLSQSFLPEGQLSRLSPPPPPPPRFKSGAVSHNHGLTLTMISVPLRLWSYHKL